MTASIGQGHLSSDDKIIAKFYTHKFDLTISTSSYAKCSSTLLMKECLVTIIFKCSCLAICIKDDPASLLGVCNQ